MRLVFAFMLLFVSSTALAKYACLSHVTESQGYVGAITSQVYCQDGAHYEGKRAFTMIFLPLPYHWVKWAYNSMNEMMTNAGFTQITKVEKKHGRSFYVYDLDPANQQDYCVVERWGSRKTGINEDVVRSDAIVICNNAQENKTVREVTEAEIAQYMESKGFSKKFDFNQRYFPNHSSQAQVSSSVTSVYAK